MARFFMAGTNIAGGMAIIRGRDAEHIKVLRLRPGEDLVICDGEGTDYKCRLVSSDKEEAQAEVIEVVPCKSEPSVKVSVLCGLPACSRETMSWIRSRRSCPTSWFLVRREGGLRSTWGA